MKPLTAGPSVLPGSPSLAFVVARLESRVARALDAVGLRRPRRVACGSVPVSLTPCILATTALLAWGLWPGGLASGTPSRLREALRNDLPSRADYERMERGYYEQILDAGRQLDGLGLAPSPADPVTVGHGRMTVEVGDVREFVLKPNLVRDLARDIPWSTNGVGMRDREYARAKPPGTFRVALAGDSIATGWRVDDGEGFEPILERAWDTRSRLAGGPAVEVLNFAVPGHGPGQRWSHFATVGWEFSPDVVLFEATGADTGWDERRLRSLLSRGVGFDAPVYRDVLASAGVPAGLDAEGYKRVLKPLRRDLFAGVLRAAAADCRSRGAASVFVLIPRVGKAVEPAERERLLALARRAGFDAVVDASDAYGHADPKDLAVGPHDFHPNAEGHARIAHTLDDALGALPAFRHLWTGAGGTPKEEGGFVGSDVRTVRAERLGPHDKSRSSEAEGADPR